MFTGLVETMGRVAELSPRGGSTRIAIAADLPTDRTDIGASIAVNGVCLKVVERLPDRFRADVVQETLDRTTLGTLRPGHSVNLERSLTLADPLGGHLVQGHVDGTARVLEVRRRGDDHRVALELPAGLARFVAVKGSVTLDGVSLTVAALEDARFEVALVPQTLRATTLADCRAGSVVNVEVDLLARYLDRLIRGDS